MNWDEQILTVLDVHFGIATGGVAQKVAPQFGHNKHTHSAFIRTRLLELEKQGKVGRLDDQNPVCWVLRPGARDV